MKVQIKRLDHVLNVAEIHRENQWPRIIRPIALNKLSTPEDKSDDPQEDILYDVVLLLLSLSSQLSMTVWLLFFEMWSVTNSCFLEDYEVAILGIFETLDEIDILTDSLDVI
jgi:hypothetical protein